MWVPCLSIINFTAARQPGCQPRVNRVLSGPHRGVRRWREGRLRADLAEGAAPPSRSRAGAGPRRRRLSSAVSRALCVLAVSAEEEAQPRARAMA